MGAPPCCKRHQRRITEVQDLELSPWAKLWRHRVIPWSAILHVVLVVLVTVHIAFTNQTNAAYDRNAHATFVKLLYPADYPLYEGNFLTWPDDEYFLYRSDRFRHDLRHMFSAYFFDADNTVGWTRRCGWHRGVYVGCPSLRVKLADTSRIQNNLTFHSYTDFDWWMNTTVESMPLGMYTQDVIDLQAEFPFATNNFGELNLASRSCVKWNVTVHFSFTSSSVARVHSTFNQRTCVPGWGTWSSLLLLGLAISVLSIVFEAVLVFKFIIAVRIVQRIRNAKLLLQAASERDALSKAMQGKILRVAELEEQDVWDDHFHSDTQVHAHGLLDDDLHPHHHHHGHHGHHHHHHHHHHHRHHQQHQQHHHHQPSMAQVFALEVVEPPQGSLDTDHPLHGIVPFLPSPEVMRPSKKKPLSSGNANNNKSTEPQESKASPLSRVLGSFRSKRPPKLFSDDPPAPSSPVGAPGTSSAPVAPTTTTTTTTQRRPSDGSEDFWGGAGALVTPTGSPELSPTFAAATAAAASAAMDDEPISPLALERNTHDADTDTETETIASRPPRSAVAMGSQASLLSGEDDSARIRRAVTSIRHSALTTISRNPSVKRQLSTRGRRHSFTGGFKGFSTPVVSPVNPAPAAATPVGRPRSGSVPTSGKLGVAPLQRLEFLLNIVTWRTLVPLFDKWAALSTVANTLNIVYAFESFRGGEVAISDANKFVFGLGAMLLWVSLSQYLRYNAHYYVLYRTLRNGLPQLGRFFVGVLPIFMAFVMFGTAVFGDIAIRFDGTTQAAITLFAVMNGDVMRETFLVTGTVPTDSTLDANTFNSQIFLYVFCFVFMYVACMAMIAIMEEAFLSANPFVIQNKDDASECSDDEGFAEEPEYRLPPHLRTLVAVLDELDATKPITGALICCR